MVERTTHQDPRLLKRHSCPEEGRESLVSKEVSPSIELSDSIDTLKKTPCFLKAHSSTFAQPGSESVARSQGGYGTVQEQVRGQEQQDVTAKREGTVPFGVSLPVTGAASGGSQPTPDVSEAAQHHEQTKAKPGRGLTLLTGLEVKMDSGIQRSDIPDKTCVAEPFFEDIKLYESEVKKKLQKYSAFLVLCDKERLSRIQSLKKLSSTDRKAFYCRLKKYDKYYKRYQSELGLDKCCGAIAPKTRDVKYPFGLPCSAGQTAQLCLCASTLGGSSSSCSTKLAFSTTTCCLSESKESQQARTTLSDSKVMSDKSNSTAAVNSLDDKGVESGILHITEVMNTETSVKTEKSIPESGETAGELKGQLQSFLGNKETSVFEDASVITEAQMQKASPSATSNAVTDNQLDLCNTVDHSSNQSVLTVAIAHSYEVPAIMDISEASRNVGLNEEVVELQSCWENDETSEAKDGLFQLEEVQVSTASSEGKDEASDYLSNVEPLLDFLAARIEWENLFEKSNENKLTVSPESDRSAKNSRCHSPPRTVTKPGHLTLHCSGFADGDNKSTQQSSASFRENLSTSDSRAVIPNLRITLSNELNAVSDQHLTLTEPPVRYETSSEYCSEHGPESKNRTATKTERCSTAIGKDSEGSLVGKTIQPAGVAESVSLENSLQTDYKELNQVFTNAEGDAQGLLFKIGMHHTSDEASSSAPPLPGNNCEQGDLLCMLPWYKEPSGSERISVPQSAKSHRCKATAKYVGQLANTHCNEKVTVSDHAERSAEAKSLNESHFTGGIHQVNIMRHTKSAGDDPCEEILLENKSMKKLALKPQGKDMKELKHSSKRVSCLKGESQVASNCSVSSDLQHIHGESDINKVNGQDNRNDRGGTDNRMTVHKGVPKLGNKQRKDNKQDSSVHLTGKIKGTLGPKDNVQKQGLPTNKNLALAHTGIAVKCAPRVETCLKEGNKDKVQRSDSSTANVTPLYERHIGAVISCKKQIAQVASILSSEASLCKSNRLSKLLTKAVTNLNKAYARVKKSSEIVKSIAVGVSQNSLPSSYQSDHNALWGSSDVDGQGYPKKHPYRSVGETIPKNSELNKQKQAKSLCRLHKHCQWLYKSGPNANFKRQTNRTEQIPCFQKANRSADLELATIRSTADVSNSTEFQNTMKKIQPCCLILRGDRAQIPGSNLNHSQEFKPCKVNLSIKVVEKSEPPIVDSQAKSTSANSPADHRLVSSEMMAFPSESKPMKSACNSKFEESQLELPITCQEDKFFVQEEAKTEAIMELPVDSLIVNYCPESRMVEFLSNSQKVKIPFASQTVEILAESPQTKSPVELQGTETQLENCQLPPQCEFKAVKLSVKEQTTDCKRDGSGLIIPGGSQSLDHPAPFKMGKWPTWAGVVNPHEMELQSDSSERATLVGTKPEGPFQSVETECPIKSFSAESQPEQLTELCQSMDNAIALQTTVTGLEHHVPTSRVEVTSCQVNVAKYNFPLEFNALSQSENKVPSSESAGTSLECPALQRVSKSSVPCNITQPTADSQMDIGHMESRTLAFHDGPKVVKFREGDSGIESKDEDSPEMEREEGEIASDNESAMKESSQVAVSQKAASDKVQAALMERGCKNHLPQNVREMQISGSLVAMISEILHQADSTSLLDNLEKLKLYCEKMLPRFVSSFELSQGVSFAETFVCRDWFLRNSERNIIKAVQLKPSALDSYVELQMMMETVQFLENKISFLRGLPTFRNLLWYDESLYSDLLAKNVGYQQQSTLYPSFQTRIQNNCYEALRDHQAQVLKSCQTDIKGQNAYYVYLKNRRELEECSAVMQNISDCCYFCLSIPVISSINYGDNLESLEVLRKNVWTLIDRYTRLPEGQRDMAKLVHLWIIIDFVNAKTRTIHSCPPVNEELWWFGLEHLQFNAAKMLVWEKRVKCEQVNNGLTQIGEGNIQKTKLKELIGKLNREALCMLYNRYNSLASERMWGGSSEQTDSLCSGKILPRNDQAMALRAAESPLPEHQVPRFGNGHKNCFRPLSDQFNSVGKILENSRAAHKEELEQLLVKCENQLEPLKTLFQVLQDVEVEKVLLTEASFSAGLISHDTSPVLLKPKAVEVYIELIMMYETVHYLRNLMSYRLSQATYRGMLWFDPALLPELLHNQQDTSIFSLFREKYLHDPGEALKHTISTLQRELDLIFEYRQNTNYTYAVQLLSRELSEIVSVKQYIQQHDVGVKTYVNAVPYAASINYGFTESDLMHNYRQLVLVLEKLVKEPKKDLGKMAHVMEVMKSIVDMRQVTAESSSSTLHILTHQMRQNSIKRKLIQEKFGRSTDGAAKVQWSMCADIITGYKEHSAPLVNMRKRHICDCPLYENGGDHEAENPPANKRKMVAGNDLRNSECQTSSHKQQGSVCAS
ncbi:hypothetical protein chiPu_0008562 [Chiloscyllium punctatum]|uniref:Testis expressed sequence 15 domain-containing protein n=1 Tax=Chiloscyllium punctatum TaxID=137246 RepID=A0A401SI62_CHIPU|nr:hypothetical protein [Chiloscyllium punctatum]